MIAPPDVDIPLKVVVIVTNLPTFVNTEFAAVAAPLVLGVHKPSWYALRVAAVP